ncbi:MAG: LacI family transcriptional regulator [Chloroflexi bacterium]|nr:MAG: LacI family transcriptional regulator [Chloroflexota bacterium]
MSVTLKDIAEHIGISVTTVSRALGGFDDVSEATRERVVKTAKTLGYTPNVSARRLQKQRTDTIGFIIPTYGPRFSDPFFSEFIAGVGNESARQNFDLVVSTHSPDSESERAAYQRAVLGGWVDGVIVVRTRENDERINSLVKHDFPFVAFGRTNGVEDFPYVDEDSMTGMGLLVQHFIDLGHQKIGFISPPKGLLFGKIRRQAYRDTLQKNRIPLNPRWLVYGDLTQHSGAETAAKLLDEAPEITALVCGNDLMAIGAMKSIRERGLQVGVDIAVGGFDDIPLAAFTNPPLTTVHQPIYEIGKRTCAMLIDVILKRPLQNPHTLLTPILIERDSSRLNQNRKK